MLNIPIAVSYDVTEKLSIGGSLDAMWTGLNLDLLLGANQVGSLIGAGRASGSLVPVLGGLPAFDGAHISFFEKNRPLASGADAWGIGGKFGLIYKATKATTLGAAYSFESRMSDLKGDATLTALDAVVGQVPLQGQIAIRNFSDASGAQSGHESSVQ
ncbi:outer membrane protein transport protein [Undibacterium arcticum]